MSDSVWYLVQRACVLGGAHAHPGDRVVWWDHPHYPVALLQATLATPQDLQAALAREELRRLSPGVGAAEWAALPRRARLELVR